MTEAERIGLIRQCFTQGLCDVLDDVIYLARVKNKQPVTRVSRSRHGRHAATSTCGSPRLPDCGAVFHTATAGA